jgi:hypothetical protein
LRGERGGWSRTHGDWHLQYELPRAADGSRRPLRDGAYPNQTDAEAALGRIRAALAVAVAVAVAGDTLCRIGDTAVRTGTAIRSSRTVVRSRAMVRRLALVLGGPTVTV